MLVHRLAQALQGNRQRHRLRRRSSLEKGAARAVHRALFRLRLGRCLTREQFVPGIVPGIALSFEPSSPRSSRPGGDSHFVWGRSSFATYAARCSEEEPQKRPITKKMVVSHNHKPVNQRFFPALFSQNKPPIEDFASLPDQLIATETLCPTRFRPVG
ncbi:hypothetical protein B0H13DRAFT_2261797 [Mycena leptocephala]|nr:hypothetical protein B0H13DRAFT_2261797 [Mycena leptocephala]